MIGCNRRHILFIFLLIGFQSYCQNLVKNPSFERFDACPKTLGTFKDDVTSWTTPTKGSTDYFNTCSIVMGAPENFNGVQQVKFGKGYAGLYFYAPSDYREYIQVPLKKMLRKDVFYNLSFYISLAEGSDFAVKDFGVVFSYKELRIDTKKALSRGRLFSSSGNRFHTMEINHPEFHEDKSDWLKVTLGFKAKGYEKYLILGNLRSNLKTRKVQTKRKETKKGAYYYIDMISLQSANQGPSVEADRELKKDSLFVLKNIHFSFDKFTIDGDVIKELEFIRERLNAAPELMIEIHGHTDSYGNDLYNKRLSEKRAKSIADYFVSVGIATERVSWVGHGSKDPITNNSNEQGRSRNRRVGFILKTME